MKKKSFFIVALVSLVVFGISILFYSLVQSKGNFLKTGLQQLAGRKRDTEIFMCADDGNAMQTCVTIASVLKNAMENEKINIHIVSFSDNPMSEKHVKKIKSLSKKIKPFNLEFVYFDKKSLEKYNTDHWNPAIMVKLFAPSLFPNLDRIIWLDDDLIVQESLNHFMLDDLKNKYMAGVEISEIYRITDERASQHWITAGVGVYNLDEMRKDNIKEFLLESARNYPKGAHQMKEYCGGAEEFALSQLPKEKIKILPYKYCVMCFLYVRDNHPEMKLEDCAVLHYAWFKPWKEWDRKKLTKKECLDLWERYLAMTDYAEDFVQKVK